MCGDFMLSAYTSLSLAVENYVSVTVAAFLVNNDNCSVLLVSY